MPSATLCKRASMFSAVVGIGIVILVLVLVRRGGVLPPLNEEPSFAAGARVVKIAENSLLRLPVDQPLQQDETLSHVVLPDALTGSTVTRKDDAIVVQPSKPLVLGETFTITIPAGTPRRDGTPLPRALTFRFIVAGPPTVTTRFPQQDGKEVPPDRHISVVFDRPMAALAAVQGANAPTVPFTLEPQTAGTWRWVSTTAAEFTPEKGLMAGTEYTVGIPTGIPAISGDPTTQDFSWHFETIRPRILSTDPPAGYSQAGPQTEFIITFNQEIDLESVRAQASMEHIIAKDNEELLPIGRVAHLQKKDDDGKTITDRSSVVIVPANPLPLDSRFRLKIGAGVRGNEGNLPSTRDYGLNFQTAGPLKVESKQYQYGSIALNFNNGLQSGTDDPVDIKPFITIDPKPENWDDLSITADPWNEGRSLSIYPILAPSTSYTVTIKGTLKDRFGQKLGEDVTWTFKTEPLAPQVFIHNENEFGIFEKGAPPVYYINGVNVSKVEIEMAELTLDQFLKLREQRKASWDAKLDLTKIPTYKSWTFPIKKKENAWQIIPFDVAEQLGANPSSGIYVIAVKAPEFTMEMYDGKQPVTLYQFFTLTNTALTLKYSGAEALVFATDLKTGEPVEGLQIEMHPLSGPVAVAGKTDAQGLLRADVAIAKLSSGQDWEPEFWVTARKGDEFAFVGSDWMNGIRPYDFGLSDNFRNASSPPVDVQAFLTTDRPFYRPGDTVHFKGIVRLIDPKTGKLTVPDRSKKATVVIRDPNSTDVYRKELPLTAGGGFDDSFTVDADAPLGSFGIQMEALSEISVNYYGVYAGFSVLEYRKPEYSVDVAFDKESYADGETIDGTIEGTYYFGSPMSNAAVQWRVISEDYYFNKYDGDGWYSFSADDSWCYYDCAPQNSYLSDGQGTLDDDGKLSVKVPLKLDDKKLSQVYSLEADITDPNNQLVSNRTSVIVHKSNAYVGIRTEEYAVQPGEDTTVHVITLTPDGKPISGADVKLSLYKRTWNSIKKKGVDGEFYYENEALDTFVRGSSTTTDTQGKGTATITIPDGGDFRIVAQIEDDKGRPAAAGTSVYAWSNTYVNWPHANNDKITITADKPEYTIGDTAKLLVQSPYQGKGVKALVTVEREGILRSEVIDMVSNAQPIDVQITEDLIPNVFVSVVILKPREGDTFDEQGKDTGAPAFKMGAVQLRIDHAPKRLDVAMTTDRERYAPGETVKIDFVARGPNGETIPNAEITLTVVDMSVLALAGFRPTDLVEYFYSYRGLGVRTATLLQYLIERYKPGSKGGGGDEGQDKTRGVFKDTAYWNPTIITDGDGKAHVEFALPDNLTTWQLLGLVHTTDSKFDTVVTQIIETKQVIVRPVRPRFAVQGDAITLGAIVHNRLTEPAEFTISLKGEGFTTKGATEQKITIQPDAQTKVEFPILVTDAEQLTLTMGAESPKGKDIITETIPVYVFGTPQAVATSGITEDVTEELLYVPTKQETGNLTFTATLSPTLATYLPKGLDYLAQFPYGCAEQLTSSFLPNVVLKRLKGFDAFKIVSDKELEKNVSAGIQKLSVLQRPDGGFGFWPESKESFPYISAYVLYAFQQAKLAGYTVDETMLSRAREYLQNTLRSQRLSKRVDLASRAYILFVLGEGGASDESLLNNLYDKREELPLFAKAYLAMAFQKAGNASRARSLIADVENEIRVDARGAQVLDDEQYRELFSTPARTTAIAIQAMIRLDPDHPSLPALVRWLLDQRDGGHWDTTQSTSTALISMIDYLNKTGELDADYDAVLAIMDDVAATAHFDKTNVLTQQKVTLTHNDLEPGRTPIRIGKEGKGLLYYDLLMEYFWKQDVIEPIEEGFGITRTMEPLNPKDKNVPVGSTHKVTLTVSVPEHRRYVAVESPLPAGMEPIDFKLQTSSQIALQDEVDPNVQQVDANGEPTHDWWWWSWSAFEHIEMRDDRVFLFAQDLQPGIYRYQYLVRATTPGRFRERPARVWEMYFPETFAQTGGNWFTVSE